MKTAHWIWLPLIGVAMLATFSASSAWAGIPCPVGSGSCCGDTTGPLNSDVPCECGDTVTTNTVLNATDFQITKVCAALSGTIDAVLFVNPNVNLNMKSAVLKCDRDPFGIATIIGILILGDGVVVDGGGGIIDGCDIGVFAGGFNGTSNSTIRRVTVRNGQGGIVLLGQPPPLSFSFNNTLVGNLCHNNDSVGIFIFGAGNTLDRNYCKDNGGDGIVVRGRRNHLQHNRAQNNGGHGIFVPDPTNTTDFRNYATGNGLEPQCVIDGSTGKYC